MSELSGAVIIPLSGIPAQRLQCVLGGQNCTITIKKRGEYSYFSLMCNGNMVTENTICLSGNNLVPYVSQYFNGSIFFIDTNGHYSIPNYREFNSRYRLVYVPFTMDMSNISQGI